jgi:hypothetical protein
MSCWVVPQVAAEIWGISLSEVLSRIHAGVVISKMEYGFLLVDTAPLGPMFRSTAAEGRAKPPTWVAVKTWEDVEDEDDVLEETLDDAGIDIDADGDSIEEEPEDGVALGWREKRMFSAKKRRPPAGLNSAYSKRSNQ